MKKLGTLSIFINIIYLCCCNLLCNRTRFNTFTTSSAAVKIYTACAFLNLNLKITRNSFNGFNVRISDKFNV